MAEAFHRPFGLPVATLRPLKSYGPRQSRRAVIPTIISQALDGRGIRLGNLEPTRDFTFVDDTVAGFTGIADCPGAVGRTVNVGTGREVSIRDLVSAVLGLLGKEAQVLLDEQRVRPDDSEVYRLCADVTLASELMGWSAGHSLEEGLVKTIEWIRENVGRYEAGAYAV